MAGFADIRRINVARWQTVATRARASTEYFIMVNCERWNPAGTYMARFANVRRINVASRQTEATCASTGAKDFIVVNRKRWNPA